MNTKQSPRQEAIETVRRYLVDEALRLTREWQIVMDKIKANEQALEALNLLAAKRVPREK
jgi:hypothetical protein